MPAAAAWRAYSGVTHRLPREKCTWCADSAAHIRVGAFFVAAGLRIDPCFENAELERATQNEHPAIVLVGIMVRVVGHEREYLEGSAVHTTRTATPDESAHEESLTSSSSLVY